MTTKALPAFRYHPNPLDTGSIIASDATCVVCTQRRGFIYSGPVYGGDNVEDTICPWCIADGSAHDTLGVTFATSDAFPAETPTEVVRVIAERTPGYSAWQAEEWPSCCGDAAAFIGPLDITEIRANHQRLEGFLMSQIVHGLGMSGPAATQFLESLRRDTTPTAYLFTCLHCHEPQVHVDP